MTQKRFSYFFLTLLNGLLFLMEQEVGANPTGHEVTSGNASLNSSPQKLEVTAHDRTIISWKDFSIASQETTRFNLPSSKAVVLNRVGSNIPSKIEGLLSSNGVVYLINPNGILITASGKIDTAGFLASTLNVADQDFLNGGDLLFTGSSGTLINQGTIRCSSGDVILMAYQIKNEQPIEAPQGKIALGTGQEVLLTLQGNERLTVRLGSTPANKDEVGVHQTGTLDAMQAELKADGNLYAYAIKNEGAINAISSVEHAGRIYLVAEKGFVANSGKLTAPSGEVRILGQTTTLTGEAEIDVSGEKGGGTILVGGDYQGKNPEILNAEFTFVEPQVKIKADAILLGDGGKVIFWADKMTAFNGYISAQGGKEGGDGGFIEVSGKDKLDFHGLANTFAPLGKMGTLLLDPTDVTISAAANNNVTPSPCGPPITYNPTGNPVNIQVSSILASLTTCNVLIDSNLGSGAISGGNVTINASISIPNTNVSSLTINSSNDILINADITNASTSSMGSLSFTANRNIAFSAAPFMQTGGGSTTFTASHTTDGSFSTDASSMITTSGSGNITITASNTVASGTAISILGNLVLGSSGSFSATASSGNVTIVGNIASMGGGPFTAEITGAPGAMTIGQTGNTVSFINGSTVMFLTPGFGNITLAASVGMPMIFGTSGGGGSLTVNAGGSLSINAPISYFSSGTCAFTAQQENLSSNSNGVMTFENGCGPVTFESVDGAINLSVNPTTTVTFNSGAKSVSFLTDPSTGGSIGLGPFVFNSGSGNTVTINSAGGISYTNFTYGNGAASDTVMMTAVGNIEPFAGTLTFNTSSLVMDSTAGLVQLQGITFGAGANTYTVTAGGLEIAFVGAFNYSSPGDCSFLASTINNNAGGIMIFNGPGGGVSGGDVSFEATIHNVDLADASITFNPGAGNVLFKADSTGAGTGINLDGFTFNSGNSPLPAKAATFTSGGVVTLSNFTYGNNSGTCNINAGSNITTASGTTMTFNTSSLVMNTTGGSITTGGGVTFGASAGALTMTTETGSINIEGPVNYSGTGNFLAQSTAGGPIDTVGLGTVTFNAGAGSLTMTTSGNISIAAAMINNSSSPFTFTSSSGTIVTDETGSITSGATAGPLTMTAHGSLQIQSAITYNSPNIQGVTLTSNTSNITITAPVTITTTAPLSLLSSTGVVIQNQVTNSSATPGGTMTVTGPSLTVGLSTGGLTTPSQLGSAQGNLILNVTSVSLWGSTLAGNYAQIGYNIGPVNSNISFAHCNSVSLQSGSANNCYALIGHGSPGNTGVGAGSLTGNINFGTPTAAGGVNIGSNTQFVPISGTNCFMQIGHTRSTIIPITASGDITLSTTGNIALAAGNNSNTYALIGHGGAVGSADDSYTGDVIINATGNISLVTKFNPNAVNSFAAIGPSSINTMAGTTTIIGGTTNKISAIAGGNITLDPEANNECIIGSYVKSTGGGTGSITINTIVAQAGNSLTMTSLNPPGSSVNGALIGALAYTGAVPFVAAGTATSTLNVTVGGDLEMQTSFGGSNTSTFTAIQNGLGGITTPATVVAVAGSISLMGGNNLSTINSLGALTVTGIDSVTLLADQTTGSAGAAIIAGNGNTRVSGASFTLTGFNGGPAASIQSSTGTLSVPSAGPMSLTNNANITLSGGSGLMTVTTGGTSDLNLSNTALIQNLGSGGSSIVVGGATTLTAGVGSATIVNGTGDFSLAITDNLNLITNPGGSASVTSSGPTMTITAQNMTLGGIGTVLEQSLIEATAGTMLLIAQNNVTLNDNALIANTGTGFLKIVVDEQAPVSPQIGTGRFILGPDANVTTGGGALRVFTGRPNGITAGNLAFGQLNALSVTAGLACPFDKPVPSALNQYSTYYLTFVAQSGDPAYTIYYKEPFGPVPPGPSPSPNVIAILERGLSKTAWASSEVFWFLREYPRYELNIARFLVCNNCCRNGSPLKKLHHQTLHPESSYPLIYQNWTLYPIEFRWYFDCDEVTSHE